eukprot:77215-Prymnesium_polylepis.1
MVSKHLFNGLAFRSPLHPRAPRNLRARPPRALRSVGLDSSTLRTSYRQTAARMALWPMHGAHNPKGESSAPLHFTHLTAVLAVTTFSGSEGKRPSKLKRSRSLVAVPSNGNHHAFLGCYLLGTDGMCADCALPAVCIIDVSAP